VLAAGEAPQYQALLSQVSSAATDVRVPGTEDDDVSACLVEAPVLPINLGVFIAPRELEVARLEALTAPGVLLGEVTTIPDL
jgi:hypothetical protein